MGLRWIEWHSQIIVLVPPGTLEQQDRKKLLETLNNSDIIRS
jgi:hypothetical protein